MKPEDYFIYMPSSNLITGLFVDLELTWIDHPFAFSRFLIKSDKEIATIRRLRPQRIKVYPGRSNEGILFSELMEEQETATSEPSITEPELAEALAAKREHERRGRELRARRREVNREYRDKSQQIRQLTDNMKSKPANAIHDLDGLVDELAQQFGSGESLLTRLVDLSSKEYSDVHHTTNVTMLSLMLGSAVGVAGDALRHLASGAMLHDIGKINIPAALCKKSERTAAEDKIMQGHPGYGRTLVERVRAMPAAVLDIIEHHHEYLDGSGYPHGLGGDQISQLVRIVSIVNHYDRLCNPADLGQALTPKNALARLYRDYAGRLDVALVGRLVEVLGIYPPGSVVQLTGDQVGLVIASNSEDKMQPDILIYDPAVAKQDAVIIRLSEYEGLSIERALKRGEYPEEIHEYFGIQERIGYLVDAQIV
jgi:HD-GYP domain-containing protein (c-di-GMP phosphodiesterase class II)